LATHSDAALLAKFTDTFVNFMVPTGRCMTFELFGAKRCRIAIIMNHFPDSFSGVLVRGVQGVDRSLFGGVETLNGEG